jgi:hypothetical protein
MQEWMTLKSQSLVSLRDILEILKSEGFFLSDWVLDIFERRQSKVFDEDIYLYKIPLRDIGVKGPVELGDVYLKFEESGYKLLDPQVALYIRQAYVNQPTGEWLRIAVPLDSMVDSDGIPHLPKLGSGLGRLYIETYWSWPNAIFHPHNEFIVSAIHNF